MAFSSDGKNILSFSNKKIIKMWRLGTSKPVLNLKSKLQITKSVFSPDGLLIATVAKNDKETTLQLWDTRTVRQIAELELPEYKHIYDVTFSPDSRKLFFSSEYPSDEKIRIWNLEYLTQLLDHDFAAKLFKSSSLEQGYRLEGFELVRTNQEEFPKTDRENGTDPLEWLIKKVQ